MTQKNIQTVNICSAYHAINKLNTLYLDAFPPEERREWSDIVRRIDKNDDTFILLAFEDNSGSFIGFISMWNLPSAVYIEHFAVDSKMRGNGIGSTALQIAAARCGNKPIVLEVEPIDDDSYGQMAKRRVEFYRRNGFTLFDGFDYMQPPYAPELPSVRLMLMSTDSSVDPEVVSSEIHKMVYGVG